MGSFAPQTPDESGAEECIHGLGLVSACTICNGRDNRERNLQWEVDFYFEAKHHSECPLCDGAIHVGQRICMTKGGKAICWACGFTRKEPGRWDG